ncbi:MAG: hypothetical protein ACN2B6_00675 [Rickettsiales bacterium]
MEVQMVARASGPFGELNRKQRLASPKYPNDYLKHLVDIGVATVLVEDKPEPAIEVKAEKKSTVKKRSGSASPAAQASQKEMSLKPKGLTASPLTQTTK